ncbi:MAG: 50S ribosomal protein L24 [Chloroflexi bacterium]|nr:50S ribosomal protein L24 [Chloroflexota bacterium]
MAEDGALKIRRNDTVLVIAGKDHGKKGRVHRVFPREGLVLVEGVNLVKRHIRPRAGVRQAGIIEKEAPIPAARVMLMCGKCSHPARLGQRRLQDGTRVRVCRACGEVVD